MNRFGVESQREQFYSDEKEPKGEDNETCSDFSGRDGNCGPGGRECAKPRPSNTIGSTSEATPVPPTLTPRSTWAQHCVNNSGQITGTTYYHTTGSPPPAPVSHSFLWTPGTGMTYFPTGAGSNGFWEAISVNDAEPWLVKGR